MSAGFEVEWEGRALHLRLNNPPRNILTSALQAELGGELAKLRSERDHNVVLISTALADFSVGADIREHIGRDNCERMLKSAHGLIAEVLRHPVPVVACVRGKCLGGGYELVLACDHAVATDDAMIGLPEITLGCYPPAATVLAPWKLPSQLAHDLVLTGRVIPAADAAARGAGIECVSNLEAAVDTLAEHYSSLPRGPLEEATRLLRAGAAERFEAAIGGIEADYLDRLLQMRDAEEGPQAFLAKRNPSWDHKSA